MRTVQPAFLWALLLAAAPAFAAEDLGPWQLGMSKEQVTALADQGPYTEGAGGALEVADVRYAGRKVKATLVFGSTGLSSIQYQVYAGKAWRDAQKAVLEVHELFKKNHGGADVKDISDNIATDEFELILRQTLGTSEEMNKRYAPNGQYLIQTFDMSPRQQPAEVRLHCQWTYDGKANTFTVVVYQDRPGAPRRQAEEDTQIKKL